MTPNSSDEIEDRKPAENFVYSPIKEPKIEPDYVIIGDDDEPPPAPPPARKRASAPLPPTSNHHHQVSPKVLQRQLSELKKLAEGQQRLESRMDEIQKATEELKPVIKNMVKFMRDNVGILSESRKMINEAKGHRDLLEVVKVLLLDKTASSMTTTHNQGPSTSTPGTPALTPDSLTQTITSPSPLSVSQNPSTSSEHRVLSPPPPPPRVPSVREKTFCVFCDTSSHHSKDCNTFDTSRKRLQQLTTVTNHCTRCLSPRGHPKTRGACPAAEHNDCSFCGVRDADHHAILCPDYPLRTAKGMVKPRNEPKSGCRICHRNNHETKECQRDRRSSSRAPRRLRAGSDAQNQELEPHGLPCIFCARDNHSSVECRTYRTADARQARVRQEHRCSMCLKRNDSTDPSHHPDCEKAGDSCDHCSTDEHTVNHHFSLCPKNQLVVAQKRGGASGGETLKMMKKIRRALLDNSNPE